ncbi:conserved protein of unknown function [Limnospira indica PCC 8005]|uniref:Uncharacterized protein n=1 Tax=Limnospira indica PCC 8005 TaxID=376219 RepID=A0A9P1NYL6_9CYAN|nr:conserved protein of unknown function [Limnospira indica PCC 8005]
MRIATAFGINFLVGEVFFVSQPISKTHRESKSLVFYLQFLCL